MVAKKSGPFDAAAAREASKGAAPLATAASVPSISHVREVVHICITRIKEATAKGLYKVSVAPGYKQTTELVACEELRKLGYDVSREAESSQTNSQITISWEE